eukprot:CAMPEP_0197456142 /NCGR_PEP_ID=MMETSP1175-20131217/42606_1 /TAXON_ID=1003142 /ORGANISM="Triceratium dubium, Strain CCMP147" /LENGTH=40 /DNA_ID= /DNA_START= /DNA_END= /DNA_ORIENTATION=
MASKRRQIEMTVHEEAASSSVPPPPEESSNPRWQSRNKGW